MGLHGLLHIIIQELCTLHCCGHVFTVGVITRWALDEIKFASAHRPTTRILLVIVTFLHERQVFIMISGIYKMCILLGKPESVYICCLSTLGDNVCSVAMAHSDLLHVLCMFKQALILLYYS